MRCVFIGVGKAEWTRDMDTVPAPGDVVVMSPHTLLPDPFRREARVEAEEVWFRVEARFFYPEAPTPFVHLRGVATVFMRETPK